MPGRTEPADPQAMSVELFSTDLVIIGRFRCAADDPRFSDSSIAWNWPSIAFPRVSIGFSFGRTGSFSVNTTTAALFNHGQEYTRHALDPRGSCTEWIEVRPDALASLVEAFDPAMSDRAQEGSAYRFASAPIPSSAFFQQRLLHSMLRLSDGFSTMEVEEAALSAVNSVVAAGYKRRLLEATPTRATLDAVDYVCACLQADFVFPPTLTALASDVDLSPSHLCTAFRSHMGVTMRTYLHAVRLHRSLEMLEQRELRVCDIALSLGYSSESHFSDRFRSVFGLRPSQFRKSLH